MRLILGSESKWRRQLFADMGYSFEAVAANIDEGEILDNRPDVLAMLRAIAKSKKLQERFGGPYILLTADQIVTVNGKFRHKPVNFAEAHQFLESAHLHPSVTYSAIVVYNSIRRYLLADVAIAKVFFKPLPAHVIDALVDEGDVMQCAGGFTCESPLISPYIEKMEGEMDSVQGFPKKLVSKLLKAIRA